MLAPAKLHLTYMPFNSSAIFVLLCISILLRWPDRGFVGIFTTDSISSKFSLRLLFINLIVTFIIGIIILIGMKKETYSAFEVIAVLIISFMLLSSVFAWINLKLLYRYELERFIMKEELRVHNITVNLDTEDLTDKMVELEDKNKEIADKLSSRNRLMDINENLP
jgi:predicted membrane protein